MTANPTVPSKLKPPRDYFPLIYWSLFILGVPIVTILMVIKSVSPKPQVGLPVFNREVATYHIITLNDIIIKRVNKDDVSVDIVLKMQDLVGHYTLDSIKADQPIREGQIGPKPDPRFISNTLAVAIPTSNATILGSNLHAGDVVSLAAMPLSNTTALPTIVFNAVLVLDVKAVGSQAIIILAIPTDHWLDFLAKTHNATVILAQQIE